MRRVPGGNMPRVFFFIKNCRKWRQDCINSDSDTMCPPRVTAHMHCLLRHWKTHSWSPLWDSSVYLPDTEASVTGHKSAQFSAGDPWTLGSQVSWQGQCGQ